MKTIIKPKVRKATKLTKRDEAKLRRWIESSEGGGRAIQLLDRIGGILPAFATIDKSSLQAGIMFWSRSHRITHPDGHKDKAGRWYPYSCEDPNGQISINYRSPSRAWPYSYMLACRTAVHCADLSKGADVTLVRRVKRLIDKQEAYWEAADERAKAMEEAGITETLTHTEQSVTSEIALG